MLHEANKPCGRSGNGRTLGAAMLPECDGVVEASARLCRLNLLHSDGAIVCKSSCAPAPLPRVSQARQKFRLCGSWSCGRLPETRPRHTEFYMTLLQRITMMYEGELVPYCAESCLSSLTSCCPHHPPPQPY